MRRFEVILDPAAEDDLAAIRDHIAAASSRETATSFISRVLDHLARFETAPQRGTLREDIRPGLRTVGWRRTLTFAFRIDQQAGQVTILAVLYRGRDVEAALRRRSP